MTIRVVVYGEGRRELSGLGLDAPGIVRPAPTDLLLEEELGPAHILVRRVLERERRIPANAVQFEEPLRLRHRMARGSDLLEHKKLKRLLTWLDVSRQPDLAVILIDSDDDGWKTRRERVSTAVRKLPIPVKVAVGVAVHEFEA